MGPMPDFDIREDSHTHRWDRNSYDNVSARPEPQPICRESIRGLVREAVAEEMANMEVVEIVKETIAKASAPPRKLYSRKLRIRR